MIVTGLIGALVESQYKWGYFVIGCVAFVMVAYIVIAAGMPNAKAIGQDVYRLSITISIWTIFLWTLYPIAWGLCEGGNVISPDSEAVFYGVLDVLAKPVFGFILLYGHTKIDPGRLGLRFSDYPTPNERSPLVPKPGDRTARDGPVASSSGANVA
jgi:bacteriorhodopsin